MTTEKSLDKKLREEVRKAGGWSIKLHTTFIKGMPDRLLLFKGGRVAFAEIKTKGQKPKPIQTAVHRRLKKLGFDVYVVDDNSVINRIIKEYERHQARNKGGF